MAAAHIMLFLKQGKPIVVEYISFADCTLAFNEMHKTLTGIVAGKYAELSCSTGKMVIEVENIAAVSMVDMNSPFIQDFAMQDELLELRNQAARKRAHEDRQFRPRPQTEPKSWFRRILGE